MPEPVAELRAGRDLDALVAERVMGWHWVTNDHQAQGWATDSKSSSDAFVMVTDLKRWHGWVWPLTPAYSTDIAAAFEVVEKMLLVGEWAIENRGVRWCVTFRHYTLRDGEACGDSLTLAICRAALLAVSQNQLQASTSPLAGPTAHGSREQGHRDTESSESTQGAIQGL